MSGRWQTDSLVQSKDGQVHIISNQYFQPKSPLWIESTCPIPSLLLACREAFRIALPHYQRIFSCTTERVFQYKTSSPQTYFNFEHDILYIRYDTLSCTALPFCHGAPSRGPWKDLQACEYIARSMKDVDNLRRVKNIAPCFNVHDFSFQKHGVNEDGSISATYDVYWWLLEILSILGSVENVAIVLRNYSDPGPIDIEDLYQSSLCLLEEPLAIEEAIQSFLRGDDSTICLAGVAVDPEAMKKQKGESHSLSLQQLEFQDDIPKSYIRPVPRFKPKVVLEAGWKRRLDGALARYPEMMRSPNRKTMGALGDITLTTLRDAEFIA